MGDDPYDRIPDRGWWDSVPRDQRPPHIQQEYARAEFDRSEDARIYRLAAYLESKIPQQPPGPDGRKPRKPCISVGILSDMHGNRWDLVAVSGVGYIPQSVENELGPRQLAILGDGVRMHAELRIIRTLQEILRKPDQRDRGWRIEAIAAAFPICWKQCQPAMDAAGIRAASPRKPKPPDDSPASAGRSSQPRRGAHLSPQAPSVQRKPRRPKA